jgi:hypothetical protein
MSDQFLSPEEWHRQQALQALDAEFERTRAAYVARADQLSAEDQAWAAHCAKMKSEGKGEDGIPLDWFQNVAFFAYAPATGDIECVGTMSKAGLAHSNEQGPLVFVEGVADAELDWFNLATGQVERRGECPAQVQGAALVNCPLPCGLVIRDAAAEYTRHEVDDGIADLSDLPPGTYTVRVFSVPYLDAYYEVTVP